MLHQSGNQANRQLGSRKSDRNFDFRPTRTGLGRRWEWCRAPATGPQVYRTFQMLDSGLPRSDRSVARTVFDDLSPLFAGPLTTRLVKHESASPEGDDQISVMSAPPERQREPKCVGDLGGVGGGGGKAQGNRSQAGPATAAVAASGTETCAASAEKAYYS